MQHWDDHQLFSALCQGQKEALSVLFLRYHSDLLHYGQHVVPDRVLVEEAIQELFIHLLEKGADLPEVSYVKAYLFRALRNRLLRRIQREQSKKNKELLWMGTLKNSFSQEDIRFEELKDSKVREVLLEALNSLPWRQREAIYLRYYNGLNTREIAEVMGTANQTVLNTLHQGLKKIRNFQKLKKFVGYLFPWLLLYLTSI
ncbi:RNA polymerase sigma factor [Flavilitoribacter nigricans]|uniref:Sigma-70 family RNA polymerase sigma factor n=1 Tax=Flavilitoribacter nigricans (strain ATCC 23147 / DSM 23189 / NBRC 102662 / NCIMB 1420 / SS-2) TaxID=1122177 RepID=A0A2D0NGZ6_FLAN2|nr:sigma-70 family RNA polymerase sigma factor [Flavilitoribacter nigricans]PHN07688.1 hypothetical protein CRP01_06200 [Flavilitoribacter nigricans DSM 23189 = NBRC 102662]